MPISIIKGDLPKRIKSLVFEWTAEHHRELLENWENAKSNKMIKKNKPLD